MKILLITALAWIAASPITGRAVTGEMKECQWQSTKSMTAPVKLNETVETTTKKQQNQGKTDATSAASKTP